MNTIKTFEDLVDYIKANREPTYEGLNELCDAHETWTRLHNDMDFLVTDGERSVVMHYGTPVIIDANVDKLTLLSANAFATIPEDVWNELPATVKAEMSDNARFYCDGGECNLQNEVKIVVNSNWREGGFDYERDVAEEAVETLKGFLSKFLGEKVALVEFRLEEDVSEYTPDPDDIVNHF